MKTIFIIVGCLLFIAVVGTVLFMRHLAKNSPSIIGNEYDEKVKHYNESPR